MDRVAQTRWASLYANEKIVCVQTLSGLRSAAIDPRGRTIYLAPRGEPSDLGQAILDALSDSRTLTHDELPELFGREVGTQVYEQWVAKLLSASSQSSRRKLFCVMKMCEIRSIADKITLYPTIHDKLEGWGSSEGDDLAPVVVGTGSSPHDIGQAANDALSRCR